MSVYGNQLDEMAKLQTEGFDKTIKDLEKIINKNNIELIKEVQGIKEGIFKSNEIFAEIAKYLRAQTMLMASQMNESKNEVKEASAKKDKENEDAEKIN